MFIITQGLLSPLLITQGYVSNATPIPTYAVYPNPFAGQPSGSGNNPAPFDGSINYKGATP